MNLPEDNDPAALRYIIRVTLSVDLWRCRRMRHEEMGSISLFSHANDIFFSRTVEKHSGNFLSKNVHIANGVYFNLNSWLID